MNSVDQASVTQLANIQKRTGKTQAQLFAHIRQSGLTKHGEIRAMLQQELELGYGDANPLTHFFLKDAEPQAAKPASDVLDEIYSGSKADLRPVPEKVMAAIHKLGEFEIAPKRVT